jgi:prepilin-type N-terminal cleavage/methylation domain-containing protein
MFKKRLFCFFKILKNRTGFTMVEVAVTLSLLGILTAIAVPSYISWLPRHRLQTSARQIYDDLNLAKIQAVKDNANAYITFDTSNYTYFIFLDDQTINGTYESGETIIRNNATLENGVTITATTFTANTVGFNNRGLSLGLPAAAPYQVRLSNLTGLLMGVDVNTAGGISIVTSTDSWAHWS